MNAQLCTPQSASYPKYAYMGITQIVSMIHCKIPLQQNLLAFIFAWHLNPKDNLNIKCKGASSSGNCYVPEAIQP